MDAAELRGDGIADTDGGEDIDGFAGEPEIAGHDADDGVGVAAEAYGFADDIGIGSEVVGPEGVGEKDERGAAEAVFLRRERAADGGVDAERWKKIGVAEAAKNLDGFAGAGEIERLLADTAHPGERTRD